MRIEIIINDDTIMSDIQYEIDNMTEDEEIEFPNEETREEFANDCLDEIISRCECRADFLPTWEIIRDTVHDNAEANGYLK